MRGEILPGIAARNIRGYGGAYLLRRNDGDEIEFVTVLWFDSMEAVREFAGNDHGLAVVPAKAKDPLEHFDEWSVRYDVILAPESLV